MPRQFDAIVIGSGLGGLTAGALYARAGHRVLVLERNANFGRAATVYRHGSSRLTDARQSARTTHQNKSSFAARPAAIEIPPKRKLNAWISNPRPTELGLVMRFGKFDRTANPGLGYHWPYPIESVEIPKVTQVNAIPIGMLLVQDTRGRTQARHVPEESLMLTGDVNIVDVDFTVFWVVKPGAEGAVDFKFNIEHPEGTVKAVAESAMREVIGRSELEPILTGGRQQIEREVHDLVQKTLDQYKAGITVTQVQMQKVEAPTQVIDAFRDVQAAQADQERVQNEARTYAGRAVPEARGRAAKVLQDAEAYREQTVAEATGQAARFNKIYEEYKKAPEVTRQRLYLETMERVFGGTDKVLLDSTGQGGGVVPYLPLPELRKAPAQQPATGGNR